ncbi:MAG: CapA family protein [Gemmatimonadetes bacterium]|nr:CapA family protein [Gemmatimonadota bacterium]
MALTGDAIISRKLSVYREPHFLQMVEVIRGADVAFTNLEILFHDNDVEPGIGYRPELAGTYMGADPGLARELVWVGFDVVGRANNHSADYGIGGMQATDRALAAAELAHAGAGENLARARAPAYVETANGRLALISAASTFAEDARAGPQRKDVRGRPGISPLRYTRTYVLPAGEMQKLRDVRRTLGMGESERPDRLSFLGAEFVVGERAGVVTRPHEGDREEILASIRDAKRQANWVIVTVHSHERGAGANDPAEFLVSFARAAIDAGADAFVGHGPHRLRGIEIYKERPIFYSLGNFIFENESVELQPADSYETLGLPPEALPAGFFDAREKFMDGGWPANPAYWESVVATVGFREGRLHEVLLHPISLGHGLERPQRGRPLLADEALGQRIIAELTRLSEPFGTRIEYSSGVGKVSLQNP